MECIGVLDYLETVAPVLAVRGYEDPMESGDRLAYSTRVVHVGGVSIGMIHDIQWPGPKIATTGDGTGLVLPEGEATNTLARKFGEPVDVVLFGDTHEELICRWDDVLMINPGSPTYPGSRHRRGSLGTVALLEINPPNSAAPKPRDVKPTPASSTSTPASHQRTEAATPKSPLPLGEGQSLPPRRREMRASNCLYTNEGRNFSLHILNNR